MVGFPIFHVRRNAMAATANVTAPGRKTGRESD